MPFHFSASHSINTSWQWRTMASLCIGFSPCGPALPQGSVSTRHTHTHTLKMQQNSCAELDDTSYGNEPHSSLAYRPLKWITSLLIWGVVPRTDGCSVRLNYQGYDEDTPKQRYKSLKSYTKLRVGPLRHTATNKRNPFLDLRNRPWDIIKLGSHSWK